MTPGPIGRLGTMALMTVPSESRPPVALIIRDGWGENPHREQDPFNAIAMANTPVADRLQHKWPWTLIKTCGDDVGLPSATMGNSEVGHQNIGAGRVVNQEVMRITQAIRDGSFFENPALCGAFEHARKSRGRVHFLGLVSDGLVHSDLEHLLALIDLATRLEFDSTRLFVHALTDGRDTGPKTSLSYINRIQEKLEASGSGRIASVIGRYFAMDRDYRWQRIARAYRCLTDRDVSHPLLREDGDPPPTTRSAQEAVQRYYDHPTESSRAGDEFISPAQIVDNQGEPIGIINDGDAIIFFNFRGDRPREITRAFTLDDKAWAQVEQGGFERGPRFAHLYFCTMSEYEHGLPVSAIAFPKTTHLNGILGEIVSRAGFEQFRCAETEKFPHVTFFFNDYREEPFPGESRLLVPSPREVTTYDQKPEMSALEVCEGVLANLEAHDGERLIIVNFANPDMVGHTGKIKSVIRAVEVVDECVGRIVDAVLARDGSAIVTADHGNAEQMWDPINDSPHTAHTVYDVPLIVVGEHFRGLTLRAGGRLADVAPTLLTMLGIEQPAEMTGQSLLPGKVSTLCKP